MQRSRCAAGTALTAHYRGAGAAVRGFAGKGVRIATGGQADTGAAPPSALAWRASSGNEGVR